MYDRRLVRNDIRQCSRIQRSVYIVRQDRSHVTDTISSRTFRIVTSEHTVGDVDRIFVHTVAKNIDSSVGPSSLKLAQIDIHQERSMYLFREVSEDFQSGFCYDARQIGQFFIGISLEVLIPGHTKVHIRSVTGIIGSRIRVFPSLVIIRSCPVALILECIVVTVHVSCITGSVRHLGICSIRYSQIL